MAPCFILYLIYGFRIGGAERHLLDLCTGLDRKEFKPEIIYFHREEEMLPEFHEAGIPCNIFPVKGAELSLWEIWRLSRLIKKLAPDIVHVHLFYANRFGTMAAYIAGIKHIVMTKHSLWRPKDQLGKKDRLWQVFQSIALTRMVTVSKAAAENVKNSVVIYNGVDPDYFDPKQVSRTERDKSASEFGVQGSPLIGIAARLSKSKGHPVLLEAFARLLESLPDAQLLIAGDGEERASLNLLTFKLGIAPSVHFLGSIRNVRGFLGMLDIFVHPSISEGLGIAVIEAMSMKLPVVATKVGGLKELITDGVEGILVEPNDPGALSNALIDLWNNPSLRESLGKQARKRVIENFSLKIMVKKYESLYKELCK